jgi:uncharacterized RDD family membrane protein YckC
VSQPSPALATWGRRALALIIDALILLALCLPGAVVLGLGAAADSDGSGPDQPNGSLVALGAALALAGVVVHFWQQGWRQGAPDPRRQDPHHGGDHRERPWRNRRAAATPLER